MNKIGFDNDLYLKQQSETILERIKNSDCDKLYLEFGGKILYDYHAARVLPGFDPNVKMRLLSHMKDTVDVIMCICAIDIEKKKVRADFGITYDADTLKSIDDFARWGIQVKAVVITRYTEQPSAVVFKNALECMGMKVYTHGFTKGYPTDVDLIVSEAGYGANSYIETEKPIVVVTGPGPGSGKLATCLSQMYHDHKRGIRAAYAKFETFPIWNLPLKHPVNIAYEAATAELNDVNMIDHFHLEAYDIKTVNYNRDIEAFPLLQRIIEKITDSPCCYKSPTDMGVNRAGFAIVDDDVVRKAAGQEVIRRYFRYSGEHVMGLCSKETLQRVELIMKEMGLTQEDRSTVRPARDAAQRARLLNKGNKGIYSGAAIELPDGTIVTGHNSPLLHAASSVVLSAAKRLAGIPSEVDLLPASILTSLADFKEKIFKSNSVSLNLEETLIAFALAAATDQRAGVALKKLRELEGCEIHLTHIPSPGDEAGLRKLGFHVTSDPAFASNVFLR
ncbi:MAG: DUF1846 domain-containing protein [Spirochaetia bacterium]|nr:DUF1846 domain-containing protein [Spirochaetia bacterium]